MNPRRDIAVLFLLSSLSVAAFAGPPFFTDDPVPVELHHWEIYFASEYLETTANRSGLLPFIDMNYGALPDLHLHVGLPGAWNRPDGGPTLYGFGDFEIGAKYRILQETSARPQVAIYPTVDWPTGDEERGLGNGHTQVFLPVWIQKSWGDWTTYGGTGFWSNPGGGHKNWIYSGWVVQRDLSKALTLGAELFYRTPEAIDTNAGTGFTGGGIWNLSDHYHLMLAMGRDFSGPNRFTQYAALQWTF